MDPESGGRSQVDELAGEALGGWDLAGQLSIHLINLSENATYRVEAADGRGWALRLRRPGYHPEDAIMSELSWLMDLRARGVVSTPIPEPARDGDLVRAVRSRSGAERHAVLFRWERGVEPRTDECLESLFRNLGEVTARMHLHVRQWQKPTFFHRLTWDFDTMAGERPHWGRWQDGIAVDDGKRAVFGEAAGIVQRRLQALGRECDRFGLIHGDLRLANLLVDGESLKILDFDDCGFSWFMYDAATPVSFFEDRADVPELVDLWLDGYRRIIDLPQADTDEIPTFIVLRRLLLIAWIGSHSEADLARAMGAEYTERSVGLFKTISAVTAERTPCGSRRDRRTCAIASEPPAGPDAPNAARAALKRPRDGNARPGMSTARRTPAVFSLLKGVSDADHGRQ